MLFGGGVSERPKERAMEFGSKVEPEEARRLFALALDAGVNAVDTANVMAEAARGGDRRWPDRPPARD